MKLPDAMRMLCQDIVRKHLSEESELFEAFGPELIGNANAEVILTPQEGGDAEFGATAGMDLDFVIVWKSLQKLIPTIKESRSEAAIVKSWTECMTMMGLRPEVARNIAIDFSDRVLGLTT